MSSTALPARRRTLVQEKTFDPMNLSDESFPDKLGLLQDEHNRMDDSWKTGIAASGAMVALTSMADSAMALDGFSKGNMDPSTFQPVCPASDGFYRFLQSSTQAVVGPESFVEYGPLIAGGLLRVRLELCVVESFFEEAIVPFIARNGLNWVLPIHETVETFLAGTIFALALTFILIGSTKLVNVVIFFTDLILGSPARLFGGCFYDRAMGKPVTLDLGLGPFKTRVIGPPEEQIEGMKADPSEKSAPTVIVIVLSGIVKYAGEFLKVCNECKAAQCKRNVSRDVQHTYPLFSLLVSRLFVKYSMPLIYLSVDILSFGPVATFYSSLFTTKSFQTFPNLPFQG